MAQDGDIELTAAPSPVLPNGEAASEAPRPSHAFWQVFRRLGPAGPLALVAASVPAITGFIITSLPYWIAPWIRAFIRRPSCLCMSWAS